jgi:phosphoenolpyruvate-protein kinase (PTS system EI component)
MYINIGLPKEVCINAISKMAEVNPMLGLRGCRLGNEILFCVCKY